MFNVQKTFIVEDVARRIPCIYAALENFQADHRSLMIEIEGKYYGTSYIYVNINLVERCNL